MAKRDEWLAGYACALANIHRGWREAQIVEETMKMDGITLADLKGAGVEKYDLDELRRACAIRGRRRLA